MDELKDKVHLLEDCNRFEVISEDGRELVQYGVKVRLSLQDDGKTLKVFLEK